MFKISHVDGRVKIHEHCMSICSYKCRIYTVSFIQDLQNSHKLLHWTVQLKDWQLQCIRMPVCLSIYISIHFELCTLAHSCLLHKKTSGKVACYIISPIKRYCFLIIMTMYERIGECPYDVWKKKNRTNASKKRHLEENGSCLYHLNS